MFNFLKSELILHFLYLFSLGTVKDNILFGKRFQQDWYDAVIDACALKDDLQQLSHGNFLLFCYFEKKLQIICLNVVFFEK